MRTTKISPRFFDSQWSLYRNPWTSFARELTQNAVDAGATRIDILSKRENDHTAFSFSDNGPGMSPDTIENVYFVLGQTTKKDNSTIGGFGLARIITCFAHRSYKLTTQELVVEGCGGEWEPSKATHSYDGVKLDIVLDREGHERILDTFQDYLRLCQLNCEVYIDGQRWTEWTYKNRFARDLTFGKLYTNKSAEPWLLVRVNGALMYARYTGASAQVVLEIDPARSREVLQANRDGLHGPFQDELDAFVSQLAVDTHSALRPKKNKSTAYRGSGTFRSYRKPKVAEVPQGEAAQWQAYGEEQGIVAGSKLEHPHVGPVSLRQHNEIGGLNLFDVIIEDDTDNAAVRKVIDQYDPRNWDLADEPVRSNINGEYRRGMGRLKLLLCWKAACDKALEALQELVPALPDEIEWGVGWYFSDDAIAGHKRMGGVEYLILNPCDGNGKMRFSLSDRQNLSDLIVDAAHEVAHIVCDRHDENYANLLTSLCKILMNRKQEIVNYMKAVKETALAQLDKPEMVNV